MLFVFILGRNYELSLAELLCFFKRKSMGYEFIDLIKEMNLVMFEIKTKFEPKEAMRFLGGTIKILKIVAEGKTKKEIKERIKSSFLWNGKENKINYSFTSDDSSEEFLNDIELNLRNERLKLFRIESGKENPSKAKKIDLDLSIFYSKYKKMYYLARAEAIYDTDLAEKIDMEKPFQRSELSISPRLVKILINLSEVKERQTLMDPFCGIGNILIEALMQKQKFIGVDKDNQAIKGAEKNINWIKKEFDINVPDNYCKIQEKNALFMEYDADAAATEPRLGPLKQKNFSPTEAARIKKSLENFYHAIFLKLRKYVKGRIAITMPRIVLNKGRYVSLNILDLCEKTNMKIHNPLQENGFDGFEMPFVEARENQHVVREIWILEKAEKIE